MVALSDRAPLVGSDGKSTAISATAASFSTSNGDIMAGFSSQGPTDVDFRVKPDVVAPGVNVLSSIPAKFCAAPASPLLLGVLPRHLDGDPAPRRLGRGGPAAAPVLVGPGSA